MPSWIGPWEIAIVVVLILLIFGPRKLPELGSSLGKSIRGFRKGLKEAQDEVKTAVTDARSVTDMSSTELATPEATSTSSALASTSTSAPLAVTQAEAATPAAEAASTGAVASITPTADAPAEAADQSEASETV
jgi:sec-independent protein translocase protein TatA